MKKKLEKHLRVRVWEDPITRKHLEGIATPIIRNQKLTDGYESWSVLFEGENEYRVTRMIHPKDIVFDEKETEILRKTNSALNNYFFK